MFSNTGCQSGDPEIAGESEMWNAHKVHGAQT